MTISTTKKPNWTIALGAPLLIFSICFLLTFSSKFRIHTEALSFGILADLLITAPLIYFLAIRKSNVPKLSVTRVILAGVIFAGFILRSHSNPVLHIIKTWISPIIEILVISIICRKFYIANKIAKAANESKVDFLMQCRSIIFQVFGNKKMANVISSEISVIYYAFFGIKEKSIDYKTKFTSYKENGLPIVLGVFLSLFLIETTGTHFLLSIWSTKLAWTMTVLGLYTCLQLFAHIRALKARPTIINFNSFEVRNGLVGDALIRFDNIEKIELSSKKPIDRESIKISLFKGLESHNIVVHLKNPIEVTRIFGFKKQTDTVLFFVDRPKDFLNSVNAHLMNNVFKEVS